MPPDSGTCSKDLARIYYDHETRTCKPFSYTGCGGNANRFQSIKNCYRICHPYRYKIKPKIPKLSEKPVIPRPIPPPIGPIIPEPKPESNPLIDPINQVGGGVGDGFGGSSVNCPSVNCPPGWSATQDGQCVPESPVQCPPGWTQSPDGGKACIPGYPGAGGYPSQIQELMCPPGWMDNRQGGCVPAFPMGLGTGSPFGTFGGNQYGTNIDQFGDVCADHSNSISGFKKK